MKFPRQKRASNEINLTPLIDVVFLLLIFFMVSTTFTKESHLVVELPEADGALAEEVQPDMLEILITRDGSYSLNGKSLINSQIDTLMKGLLEISGNDTDIPIVITADASATHQSVVRAMDAAGRLGFAKLQITTLQPETN